MTTQDEEFGFESVYAKALERKRLAWTVRAIPPEQIIIERGIDGEPERVEWAGQED